MITGAHIVLYSEDADADRAFFRDVLGFTSVDAGLGWLIFAMPPAEAAFHPAEENGQHEMYFLCDNLGGEMAALAKKRRELLQGSRRALGLTYQANTPRWRNAWPVSAQTSHRTRT